MRAPKVGLVDKLEHNPNYWKQRQQNVRADEVSSVERAESAPALYKRQKDISCQAEVGVPGIEHGLIRQLTGCSALLLPCFTEANVDKADASPNKKCRDTYIE